MDDLENRNLALRLFDEGIWLVFSRWSTLQVGVKEEGDDPRSHRKLELLTSQISTWFTDTKGSFDHYSEFSSPNKIDSLNLFLMFFRW